MIMRPRALCAGVLLGLGLAQHTLAHESQDATTAPPAPSPAPVLAETVEEVTVLSKRPRTAASWHEIRAEDFELRPHATTQDILNNVPGLVATQHQGGGKAMQYLIRGFDADHGTDFAVSVDGLPVNMVSHAHGQGYADTNFLIPETVDRLELYKGPYFADLGDFATAGALRIVTKEEFDENFARAEGGSFGTHRYVVGLSPRLGEVKTLLAGEAYFSDGPFDYEQNTWRYNALAKATLAPTADSQLVASMSVFATKWDASGQIPERQTSVGELDRFGAIDPTEGGSSDRENLNLQYTWTPTDDDELEVQLWGSRYSLGLYSNFSFYQETGLRFVREADGSFCDTGTQICQSQDYVPGDGIDQDDSRLLFGGRIAYHRHWSLAGFPMESELGLETRRDDANVGLHRQVDRERFFTITNVNIEEQSLSAYNRHQVALARWVRFEAGLRSDVFFFDSRDRLTAQAPDPDFEAVSNQGNRTDSIVSPKASLIFTPLAKTDLYLNFGTGFHSNDARSVVREGDGLVQAIGYELGTRSQPLDGLDVAAAVWLLDLESELTFCGDCGDVDGDPDTGGSYAPGPKSRRWGIDFEGRYALLDWLFADFDLSFTEAKFRHGGGDVPLAPRLLMNGGLTAEFDNGFAAALRVRSIGDRPANEDDTLTAEGYTVVDLLARYRWRNVEASLSILNLTDTSWREAQFGDPSCVQSEVGVDPRCPAGGGGEGVEDIHFTPGNPVGARGGVTVYF